MFEWLNTIFEFFWNLFPRVELLPPTEGGVKFKPRRKIVELEPGRLYIWWPVTTEVHTIPIKRQTIEVTQRLTTKDLETVMVCTVVVFTIDDVIKAIVETVNIDGTTQEMAQKGTVKAIMARTFEDIIKEMVESTDMRNEITAGARSALRPFGAKVEDAFVSEFAETQVFSHDGGGAVFGGRDDEDDED